MMKWNQFVLGDCYEVMKEIDDKSVDLVFTSPPDISQTHYTTDIKSYQGFQRNATSTFSRIVKDDGFILIAQTDRNLVSPMELKNQIRVGGAFSRIHLLPCMY